MTADQMTALFTSVDLTILYDIFVAAITWALPTMVTISIVKKIPYIALGYIRGAC
ncbi:MAG: hypothetical protein IJY83_01015 [Oscillospiraceae bacterium]|nr:hypothetical protein [Oscillospiraceae bacterium]